MERVPKAWFVCIAMLLAFALATGYAAKSAAQQSEGKSSAAPGKAKARLPNYYAKVTTEQQQAKLREVLKQYAPQIQEKRDELQALIAKRDAALDELLTPEQREEIAKLRATAASRRGGGSGENAKNKAKKAKAGKAKKAA